MSAIHINYNISSDISLLIKRSAIDIEKLRGKKIFITGGTGFFGVWFLATLIQIKKYLNGNLDIIVLTRSKNIFLTKYQNLNFHNNIEFIHGDIRTFKYSRRDITHLVHMATTSASETFYGESQLNKLELLYFGTKNTLIECKGKLENVLFTSSGVAYGLCNSNYISENDYTFLNTTEISTSLGLGKLNAEFLINFYSKVENYNYTVARCFTFAGQYLPLNLHYAFGNFIKDAIEKKPIVINGKGMDIRSYLFIGDAIAWLLQMLVNPKNTIYNIGSEKSISILDLARVIAKKNSLEVIIKDENKEEGNFRRTMYVPNTYKIRKDYENLSEWTDLNEIIEKMLKINY